MNRKHLLEEYRNIRKFCRQKSAEAFEHPARPKPREPEPKEPEEAPPEVSDSELSSLLEG